MALKVLLSSDSRSQDLSVHSFTGPSFGRKLDYVDQCLSHNIYLKNTVLSWRFLKKLKIELPSMCACLFAQSYLTLRVFGLWPARFLRSWVPPGKNTAVGCHALLQEIIQTQEPSPLLLCLLPCRQILHLLHR